MFINVFFFFKLVKLNMKNQAPKFSSVVVKEKTSNRLVISTTLEVYIAFTVLNYRAMKMRNDGTHGTDSHIN